MRLPGRSIRSARHPERQPAAPWGCTRPQDAGTALVVGTTAARHSRCRVPQRDAPAQHAVERAAARRAVTKDDGRGMGLQHGHSFRFDRTSEAERQTCRKLHHDLLGLGKPFGRGERHPAAGRGAVSFALGKHREQRIALLLEPRLPTSCRLHRSATTSPLLRLACSKTVQFSRHDLVLFSLHAGFVHSRHLLMMSELRSSRSASLALIRIAVIATSSSRDRASTQHLEQPSILRVHALADDSARFLVCGCCWAGQLPAVSVSHPSLVAGQ
mmetsp:Transcript_25473/g.63130  ORF Transcript_25473/g.63130 Transcript_25473/m.63130 type:complete len:271 (-) Transcript_25473:641-1453(-)